MPFFHRPRYMFMAAALVASGACLALPAIARDAPTTVTFQANNPWTQEVGNVDRYNDSHDYSVSAEAGKTLQVNLVTRNPNVFFKVKNETADADLVDTYKTGATTWSTQVASNATYTIHVYVQPDVMQRGDVAKYALQIGQYGAQDLKPATTEVTFEPGKPWTQVVGAVDSAATAHDYTVAVAAGNAMQVNLVSQNTNVHFKVAGQDGQALIDSGKTPVATWSAPAGAAQTYTVEVYVDAATMPPGKTAKYALQIGQFAAGATQPATPAAGGTAATPTAGVPAASAAANH